MCFGILGMDTARFLKEGMDINPMIKLIATDMDGTLLDEDKKLPSEFFGILNRLKEKGIAFVIASGRSYVTLYENFRPKSDTLDFICDNGAFVIVDGGITNLDIIEKSRVKEIIQACNDMKNVRILLCGVKGTYHISFDEEFNGHIQSYYINRRVMENLMDVKDDIFKVAICDLEGPQNNSFPALTKLFGEELALQISGSVWMDVMNKGVNKGAALEKIQKKLGITPEETMAFGDFYNDIDLLRKAKYSFVMENANEDMFQYGNFRAKSNAEHGVIKAIEEYIFEKDL